LTSESAQSIFIPCSRSACTDLGTTTNWAVY
jgi:hypothetical protein